MLWLMLCWIMRAEGYFRKEVVPSAGKRKVAHRLEVHGIGERAAYKSHRLLLAAIPPQWGKFNGLGELRTG
jgi:hypothetical protein